MAKLRAFREIQYPTLPLAATTALSLAVVTVRGRWSWWRLGYRSGLVVDERLGREERRCRGIALGSQASYRSATASRSA